MVKLEIEGWAGKARKERKCEMHKNPTERCKKVGRGDREWEDGGG